MRRKILAVLALMTAGMLMLTACTSSKTDDGSGEQNTAAESKTVETESAAEETEDKVENQTDAENGAAQENQEDIWTGSYLGDEESVTLKLNDDGTISFSFAQSGISGTAEVNGQEAVYSGDDDHILTFTMGKGMLSVAVSHAEGYDTSSSPLNGTYVPSY